MNKGFGTIAIVGVVALVLVVGGGGFFLTTELKNRKQLAELDEILGDLGDTDSLGENSGDRDVGDPGYESFKREGFSRYNSEVYGFSFDYPEDWDIQDYSEEYGVGIIVVSIDPEKVPAEEERKQDGLTGRITFGLHFMDVETTKEFQVDLLNDFAYVMQQPKVDASDVFENVSTDYGLVGVKQENQFGGESEVLETETYTFDLPEPLFIGEGQYLPALQVYYKKRMRDEEVSGLYDSVLSDVLSSLVIKKPTGADEIVKEKNETITVGDLQTYTNEKYGFSLQIPAHWTTEVRYDKEDFLDVGISLRESEDAESPYIFIAIGDYNAELSAGSSRYQYRGTILEDNQITVAGLPAYELVIDSGFGVIRREIHFDKGDITFSIITNGREWADQFIDTFEVEIPASLDSSLADEERLRDIAQIRLALELFFDFNGKYPSTSEGIESLVAGGIIVEIPKDPDGNEYSYGSDGSDYVLGTLLSSEDVAALDGDVDEDRFGVSCDAPREYCVGT